MFGRGTLSINTRVYPQSLVEVPGFLAHDYLLGDPSLGRVGAVAALCGPYWAAPPSPRLLGGVWAV